LRAGAGGGKRRRGVGEAQRLPRWLRLEGRAQKRRVKRVAAGGHVDHVVDGKRGRQDQVAVVEERGAPARVFVAPLPGDEAGNIICRIPATEGQAGMPILFCAHIDTVEPTAPIEPVLANGVVVERGSVEKVLERPSEAYTIQLLEDVPKLRSARSKALGALPQSASATQASPVRRAPDAKQ